MIPTELIAIASRMARPYRPSEDCAAGEVGAALVTAAGNVYSGVSVDTECSLGFCAEQAAIAEMLKARESEIRLIVAVDRSGVVHAPCGRCRELMWQLNSRNRDAQVIVGAKDVVPLSELLPRRNPTGDPE